MPAQNMIKTVKVQTIAGLLCGIPIIDLGLNFLDALESGKA